MIRRRASFFRYKRFGEPPDRHTRSQSSINMKFFLLTVALLVASAAAAPSKVKRDILPGDSRYGTEYHLQHHHVHSDNSVSSGYLPPVHSSPVLALAPAPAPAPAPQANNQFLANLPLPSTSYGVPFNGNNAQVNNQYLAPVAPAPSAPVTSYGTPVEAPQNVYVAAPAPVVHHQPAPVVHQQPAPVVHQQPAPVVNYQPAPVYGPPAQQLAPVVHHQPAQQVVHHQPAQQFVHHQPALQVVHHQPAPVVHHQPAPIVHRQPAPVYGPPARQPAPVVHQQPAPVVYQQPAPVVYQQPAPVVYQQPAQQVVHYQPAEQVVQPAQQVVHHQPAPVQQLAPVVHQQPAQQDNLVFEAPVQSIEVSQSHTIETVPSSGGFQIDSISLDSGSRSYSQQQTDSNGGYIY